MILVLRLLVHSVQRKTCVEKWGGGRWAINGFDLGGGVRDSLSLMVRFGEISSTHEEGYR